MYRKIKQLKINRCIEGIRIYLRPAGVKDASIIQKWHNDPEIMKLARIGNNKTTVREERKDIRSAYKSEDEAYHLIITKKGNTPIGFIRFNFIDKSSGNTWLRMTMGERKSRGKGYAREALDLYLKWMFYKLRVHRVTLECYSTNLRAIKLYKKIGFKKEGILREAVLINGKYHDIFSFGLLKNDFKHQHVIGFLK